MLRHHLLLFYRNLKRSRATFLINLAGLSSGLACALLIYLWVSDEMSIDKFHEKDKRLYQVLEHQHQEGNIHTVENTAGLLAESLAEEMPEVQSAVAVAPAIWFGDFTLSLTEKNIKAQGQFASKDFFNAFSYHLIQGREKQVLSDKNSIVISQDLARRLFNTRENVVGKTLRWHLLDYTKEVTVSGVFEGTSPHSSAQFDFVLSFEVFKEISPSTLRWGNYGPYTFLVLQEDTDINLFNQKIASYMAGKDVTYRTLFSRPYSEGYLYGNYENGVQAGGRITYVRLFSIIAIVILLIACINFMNLSTAKASRRVREVGIKKVVGAGRPMLVFQYLGESLLMAFSSLLIALVIVGLVLPQFNLITGKQLTLAFNGSLVLWAMGITLFTGLVAGSYPALYLSAFRPAAVLKGRLNSSLGELWARKGLVVFQFTLSIILIVSVWVIYRQIMYVQQKNLGYNKDNLISWAIEGKVAEDPATFLSELKRIPGVVNAFSMQQNIVGNTSTTEGVDWEGKDPQAVIQFRNFSVGYDMIETLGLQMVSGRSFSRVHRSDSSAIIFNQAAIEVMGLQDPVGALVNLWGEEREIIGVVKDFHFESLHKPVKPMFIKLNAKEMMSIIARVEAGKAQETLSHLQSFYQSFNPGYVFDYEFVDSDYQALYKAEQRVSTLSRYFAGLAILISCLGLFGLAAFTAERRIKEIGIRKILGSSEFGIVYLLSGDFTKIVLAAIFTGLPLSYVITSKWLEGFAYRVELVWWYFAAAGLLALLIAWATVGFHAVKAALINPSECLRNE